MPALRAQPAESFDAMAHRVLPPLFDEVRAMLAALPADVMPDAAKPVRKLLGKLRDHLDLFAPVFAPDADWRDRWAELRAAVDEGYGVFGAFKDLYDTQEGAEGGATLAQVTYDPAELAARRDVAFVWRARFLRPAQVRASRRLLGAGASSGARRRRSGLSPRFWGTPGPRPERDAPGLANLARLVRYRLREARKAWTRAAAVPRLDGRRPIERFHDARKRSRALVHVLTWFPQILAADEATRARLECLHELVRRQGKILDRLNADDEASASAEWRKLRRWSQRHDVEALLRELRRRVPRRRG